MYRDDKYMFCAVRVNDLFITNNEWRELDWVIYTVFNKTHVLNRVRFNNTTLRKNVIAGYTGFDYIKQHFGYREIETIVWLSHSGN